MNRHMKGTLRMSAVLSACTAVTVCGGAGPAMARPDDATVRPGQSIQQAIDRADDGSTVTVRPGIYRESLTISRPVQLVAARGAVLMPPEAPPDNLCTRDPDTIAGVIPGICIAGTVADPDAPSPAVIDPVDHVRVSGLTIRGYNFAAVEAYGARHLVLDHLTATDDAGGGVFVARSTDVRMTGLEIHRTQGRGLDIHQGNADVVVRRSSITGNTGEGVFVGVGTHVELTRNRIADNCVGISAIDLALPDQHGLTDLLIRANVVERNNRFCASNAEGSPSQSGTGIALVGVADSVVRGNRVTGHEGGVDPQSGERAQFSLGGLALLDARPLTGGSAPHGNRVTNNVILDNQPVDVLYDGAGSDNTFARTTCGISTMPGVCATHRDGGRR